MCKLLIKLVHCCCCTMISDAYAHEHCIIMNKQYENGKVIAQH